MNGEHPKSEALAEDQSPWVRFTERRPAEDETVLVWYDCVGKISGYIATLDYDPDTYPLDWLKQQSITHWMTAPDGPKS